MTSALNLMGLPEAAKELGMGRSVDRLMRRHNLDPTILQSFDGYLPAQAVIDVLESAAEEFDCPHFGLIVAKYRPSLAFGVLAQLMKASPNIGVALQTAHRRLNLFTQSSLWDIQTNADAATISRVNRYPFRNSSIQMQSLGIGSYFKLLQALTEPGWHPTSVSFMQPAPPPASRLYYRQLFGAPVYFDRELDCISLAAADLQRPIPTSDPALLAIIEQHIATLEAPVDEDFRSQVNLVIRQLLDTGTCTMEVVAAKLGMHSKTLQRSLQEENTTFKELLSEARMQVAEFYLSNSQIELVQLTDILGYSCPSALSRSFKKHHGVSPQNWRKAL